VANLGSGLLFLAMLFASAAVAGGVIITYGARPEGLLESAIFTFARAVTYEIMSPERVGVPRSMIVLGKHSGRHALEARYRELGYTLTREELEKAYIKFLEVADRKKRVEDQDLISIHESAHSVAAG